MTTPISGTSTPIADVLGKTATASGAGKTAITTATTTGGTTGGQSLGQDAFLKLLVAQLRYQDPSNPADSTTFLAQTAQFTQVEKLSDLITAQQATADSQRILAASAMVGRTATYPGPDGTNVSGVVSSVSLASTDPVLRIGTTDVPLSTVTNIKQ